MSLKDTLSLAHSAQCKLHIAANRPDRNLRFVLGHALTLDNLTLRLMEIEEEQAVVQQPAHATGVKFKAAGTGSTSRKRSPPPSRLSHSVDPDEEDEDEYEEDDDGVESDDDQDELALTRFPSGSTRPVPPPPLVPSDEDSDEEDEPPSPPPPMSEDQLRKVVNGGNGDELLVSLYKSIKKCPCHGHTGTAPEVQQIWEIPRKEGQEGTRFAVAEIAELVTA